jgi:hypothetical protein
MMVVLGLATDYNPSIIEMLNINEYYLLNTCLNCLYHGVDWMYSFVETLYVFDFIVVYLKFLELVSNDSIEFFFSTYWFYSWYVSNWQLIWNVFLDKYFTSLLIKLPYTDDWFRQMLASKESSLFLIHHPEFIFIQEKIFNIVYLNYIADVVFSLYDLTEREGFLTPVIFFPQFLLVIFLLTVLVSFYFTFFASPVKEEAALDVDHLNASVMTECEKEIGSLDDMLFSSLILIYFFGWYFLTFCWFVSSNIPEMIPVFYMLPVLYYVIFCIPTCLVYDFGIFFVAYLRGASVTPVLIAELMYDYIAFLALYIRLLVQGVRIILMTFTYASFHDLILFYSFDQTMTLQHDTFWEELSNVSVSVDSVTYFLVMVLPSRIMYWMYELLHMFFVVTAQFVAFFAMTFWLFFFLFTFFVSEKQENYFTAKRAYSKKKIERIIMLKK